MRTCTSTSPSLHTMDGVAQRRPARRPRHLVRHRPPGQRAHLRPGGRQHRHRHLRPDPRPADSRPARGDLCPPTRHVLRPHRQHDAFGLLSMPNYVIAVLLILIFPFGIGIFPAVADGDVGPFDIYQLFLPVPRPGARPGGRLRAAAAHRHDRRRSRRTSSAWPRPRACPRASILFRHALRPSSLTLLTVVGLNVGQLLAGAVIIEVIFDIQGLGTLLTTAVVQRDYLRHPGGHRHGGRSRSS